MGSWISGWPKCIKTSKVCYSSCSGLVTNLFSHFVWLHEDELSFRKEWKMIKSKGIIKVVELHMIKVAKVYKSLIEVVYGFISHIFSIEVTNESRVTK